MVDSRARSRLARNLLVPLAAALLLAAAWYAGQRTSPAGLEPGPEDAARTAEPVPPDSRHVYYGPRNSVAVLPFAVPAPARDQAAQALGFAGEILDRLLEAPGIRVTARSSSFFFRDAAAPTRIVAERLQSAYVVSGQWHEAQGAISVTAVLYDAYRDRELLRSTYASRLADLLALRDDVVRDLLAALPPAEPHRMPPSPPVDPQAWLLLQDGRFLSDALGPTDLPAAERAMRAALELRPDYHAARLELAKLWLHPARPGDAGAIVEQARAGARRVLESRALSDGAATQQDAAWAWGLLSHIRHRYDWQWQAAAEAAQRALELAPRDAGLMATASLARFTLGDLEQARVLLQESVARDPLNLASRMRLGLVLEFSGRYDDALASYRQLLALRPDYAGAHAFRARVKVLQGKHESALRESRQEVDPFWRRYAEALALLAGRRDDEAEPLLQQMMKEDGADAAFQLAEILAHDGQAGEAFAWLERARRQRDPGLSALLGNPLLENLHADPRWADLLRSLTLPLDWND